MRNDTQYVALTHSGVRPVWVVYMGEPGLSQEQVIAEARDRLMGRQSADYYDASEAWTRLTVMSKSAFQRAYREAWRAYKYQVDAGAPH